MQTLNMKTFGISAGDTVKPTSEYERVFNSSFYATVLWIDGEIAVLEKDNGERALINCYWLERVQQRRNNEQ